MRVTYGNGSSSYGKGVVITLTADEVANAIDAYLVAHDCHVSGPRTIRTGYNALLSPVEVYVDPSGQVVDAGVLYDGSIGKRCPSSNHDDQ